MNTPYDDYDFVVSELHTLYGARVIKKEDSAFHIALSWLIVWTWRLSFSPLKFERTYMTRYTTVIGKTIATPSKRVSTPVLMHEAQHIEDLNWLLRIAYLLPNALAPLALLSIWYSHWWLLCAAFLVCPSPGRAWAELRGYTVSLAAQYRHTGGNVPATYITWLTSQFTGPTYLWMWPFKGWVTRYFNKRIEELRHAREHHSPGKLPLWAYKAVADLHPDL
jgi:hypothetical protein